MNTYWKNSFQGLRPFFFGLYATTYFLNCNIMLVKFIVNQSFKNTTGDVFAQYSFMPVPLEFLLPN